MSNTSKKATRPDAGGRSRQTRYVASGRQIAVVIRDDAALQALQALEVEHGGVTAAVTAALIDAGGQREHMG